MEASTDAIQEKYGNQTAELEKRIEKLNKELEYLSDDEKCATSISQSLRIMDKMEFKRNKIKLFEDRIEEIEDKCADDICEFMLEEEKKEKASSNGGQ